MDTVNWSPVMFVGVIVIATVLLVVRGGKVYHGPVVTAEGYERAISPRPKRSESKIEASIIEKDA
jgi:hypothetical protein